MAVLALPVRSFLVETSEFIVETSTLLFSLSGSPGVFSLGRVADNNTVAVDAVGSLDTKGIPCWLAFRHRPGCHCSFCFASALLQFL